MDKHILFTIFLSVLYSINLFGQVKNDHWWVIGGSSAGDGIQIGFNNNELDVSFKKTGLWMEGSNTSMSSPYGKYLFASNGCRIANAQGKIMENGNDINPGVAEFGYCTDVAGGSPLRQGVIALPSPSDTNLFYVFNIDLEEPYANTQYISYAPQRLYCQTIDMHKNNGLGAVVQKNQVAIFDTFSRGNISAVRHANGKDWWVTVPKSHSNCYFMLPVTEKGIGTAHVACAGDEWTDYDAGTQTVFSPNGKKYARVNHWNGLHIYDFDNATGTLSNPVNILFPDHEFIYISGLAISPNSRFIYVSAKTKVFQFDLQAKDIAASKVMVAEWDGVSNPYPTIFYLAALAPDGKIYISGTSSSFNLHVIHKPNCPGLSCGFEQRGVTLPSYNFATIPNIPHYRMSNDSCETNSTHGPDAVNFKIYPNPVSHSLWINLPDPEGKTYGFHIHDLTGRTVQQHSISAINTELNVSGLAPGAYYYILYADGRRLASGRFVRVD